ncbi:MAG TPA: hypothetical protein VK996_13210 [Ramlibacter sp.]|nr:hypothetical protein [Ramlibacter sp.]
MPSLRIIPLAAVVVLLSGCASSSRMPADFRISDATFEAAAVQPQLVLDGTRTTVAGGAVSGAGVGFIVGGIACGMLGPLAVVCFASAMVPTTLIGAATGAAVTGAKSDSASELERKWQLVQPVVAASPLSSHLAAYVTKGAARPAEINRVGAVPRLWKLRITALEISTAGTGTDQPFSLGASSTIEVVREGQATPAFKRRYAAAVPERRSIGEWSADDAAPLRSALDGLMQQLAIQMACDLTHSVARRKNSVRTTGNPPPGATHQGDPMTIAPSAPPDTSFIPCVQADQ